MTNLLPLETWRQVLGYNPWHFWGFVNSSVPQNPTGCDDIIQKYDWQGPNQAGRESIARAIETAETRLAEYLGFDVAPVYHDIIVPFPKYMDRKASRRYTVDPSGRNISVRVPNGLVQQVGIPQLTLLGTPAVVYTTKYISGVLDTATITITVPAGTDPASIRVYFQATDRLNNAAVGDDWRIMPVYVSIASDGVTCTIYGKSYLFGVPANYENYTSWNVATGISTGLDPNVASNFVTNVEVYTYVISSVGQSLSNSQAVLYWETEPCHGQWCMCDSCQSTTFVPASSIDDPAAISYSIARSGIRNARLGMLTPAAAVMDPTTLIWSEVPWGILRDPDRVELRYTAGWPLGSDGNLDKRWWVVVGRLAAAELTHAVAACNEANRELYRWQFDAARAGGRHEEQYKIAPEDLICPFGTRYGQIYAWKNTKLLRLLPGSYA